MFCLSMVSMKVFCQPPTPDKEKHEQEVEGVRGSWISSHCCVNRIQEVNNQHVWDLCNWWHFFLSCCTHIIVFAYLCCNKANLTSLFAAKLQEWMNNYFLSIWSTLIDRVCVGPVSTKRWQSFSQFPWFPSVARCTVTDLTGLSLMSQLWSWWRGVHPLRILTKTVLGRGAQGTWVTEWVTAWATAHCRTVVLHLVWVLRIA